MSLFFPLCSWISFSHSVLSQKKVFVSGECSGKFHLIGGITEDGAIKANRKLVRGRDSVELADISERLTLSAWNHSDNKNEQPYKKEETVSVHSTTLTLFSIAFIYSFTIVRSTAKNS